MNNNLEKEVKLKKIKESKGITLVALVVTIVVLIILATITINIALNGGIADKTQKAKMLYENEEEKEQIVLQNVIEIINEIEDKVPREPPGNPDSEGFFTKNSTIDGKEASENNPTIPKGFKKLDTDTAEWGDSNKGPTKEAVKNGLVIQDEKENEFVWIPVPDVTKMADKIEGKELDTNGNEYYQGKLYKFNSISDITENRYSYSDYREPAYFLGRDDNIDYNNNLFTEESMQEDYNSMIASVKKYKGFYVGRYEMSLNYASKKEEISATAHKSSANMWYGLYGKAKSFYSKENNNIAVVGGMIWGSQYDRIMIWMCENSIDVTNETPIPEATRNTGSETGTEENDKLNNIYDLLGNRGEWILEPGYNMCRQCRGSFASYSVPICGRNGWNPDLDSINFGTRLTLYIK